MRKFQEEFRAHRLMVRYTESHNEKKTGFDQFQARHWIEKFGNSPTIIAVVLASSGIRRKRITKRRRTYHYEGISC